MSDITCDSCEASVEYCCVCGGGPLSVREAGRCDRDTIPVPRDKQQIIDEFRDALDAKFDDGESVFEYILATDLPLKRRFRALLARTKETTT